VIQYTEQEVKRLREKAKNSPAIIERLEKSCSTIFNRPIVIPQTALATWGLFYYCPKHSVRLEFNIDDPLHHRCPVDGEIFTGEPYDGSWWCSRNRLNASAVENMAKLYLLTEDRKWAEKAIAILEGYAEVYRDYEVHGNIPCNLPGKAFAQSITDAGFIHGLVEAYDLLSDAMTEEQQIKIRDGLFFPAADFLMEHRTNQIHNHEVIINGAIAAIGVVFDKKEYIDFGLHGKYGIYYHLDHAVLEDGLWFEGSIGYHFFTFSTLMSYNKLARHTPYNTLEHPSCLKMMHMVLNLLQPDGRFPCINDMHQGNDRIGARGSEEFLYSHYRDPVILKALHYHYKDNPRDTLEAFLYGVDELPEDPSPEIPLIPQEGYHDETGSGITIFRGEQDRYLLVKHGPYGGEHDHFDRLGISFLSHGKRIAYDMGTTGYGAKLHYQYYKNTATHNTVSIDGSNQPPSAGWVNGYEKREDGVLLDIGTGWTKPYPPLDSFALTEWDEEIYKGTEMRRRILWAEKYWVDLFTVEGTAPQRNIDYTLHISGTRLTKLPGEKEHGPVNDTKPQCYLEDVTAIEPTGVSEKAVPIYYDCDGITTVVYTFQNENLLLFAKGPDNPSISMLEYQILRSTGGTGSFLTLTETYGAEGPMIKEVTAHTENGEIVVVVTTVDGEKRIHKMA